MNPLALKQNTYQSSNNWCTPPWLFERLQEVFEFEIDGASNGEDNLLLRYVSDISKLNPHVIRRCKIFCNPPFNDIQPFLHSFNVLYTKLSCLLLPFRPETKLWHRHIWPDATVFIFNKRIQYIHPVTKKEIKGAAFPSCLVFFGDLSNFKLTNLKDLGVFICKM